MGDAPHVDECDQHELRQENWWVFHHDNTPALEQPPYSPNLVPFDFFLFRKLKGTRFEIALL